MSAPPSFARAWLAQREAATAAMARVHEDELANLDAAEALRRSEALLAAAAETPRPPARETTSGFVEQQALFHRRRAPR